MGTFGNTFGNSLAQQGAQLNLSQWLYKSILTFNTSTLSGEVVNVPIRVYLDNTTFDFSKIKAGGADIRFADKDNNLLKYEIEYWDDTLEEAVCWVLVPKINTTTDTYIYLYYGNANATDKQTVSALWNTAGAVAVWHFAEDSGVTIIDSSSTGADGTLEGVNTTPQRLRTGGVSAIQLNKYKIGTHEIGTEMIDCGNPTAITELAGDLSVLVWYRVKDMPPAVGGSTCNLLAADQGDSSLTLANFDVNIAWSDQRIYVNFGDGVLAGRTVNLLIAEWGITNMPMDTWHDFMGYIVGNYIRCSLDGSNSLENPVYPTQIFNVNGGVRQSATSLMIGGPLGFVGEIDEIKIYNRALSSDEEKIDSLNRTNGIVNITGTEVVLPTSQSGLTLTLISGGVKVDWTDNTGGTAQTEIWGKSDSAAYALRYTITAGTVTKNDICLPADLRYYKIRSKFNNAYSAFTAEESIAMVGAELIPSTWKDAGLAWWDRKDQSVGDGSKVVYDGGEVYMKKNAFWTVGKTYRINTNWTRTSGQINSCYIVNLSRVITASGTYSDIYTNSAHVNMEIYCSAADNFVGSLNALSIKEVLMP